MRVLERSLWSLNFVACTRLGMNGDAVNDVTACADHCWRIENGAGIEQLTLGLLTVHPGYRVVAHVGVGVLGWGVVGCGVWGYTVREVYVGKGNVGACVTVGCVRECVGVGIMACVGRCV